MDRILAAIEPHRWIVDGTFVGVLLALVARGAGASDNTSLWYSLAGLVAAAAFGIIPVEVSRRDNAPESRALEDAERGAIHFIATAAREVLLEPAL